MSIEFIGTHKQKNLKQVSMNALQIEPVEHSKFLGTFIDSITHFAFKSLERNKLLKLKIYLKQ